MIENVMPRLMIDRSMAATEKVFNDDPYIRTLDARVVFVQGPHVITDKTIFYAESGGQDSDFGTINGLNVVHVSKQGGQLIFVKRDDVNVPPVTVDTMVVHTLNEDAPFKVGDTVHLEIDWDRRYNLMRYHSASHFLYYAAHRVYDKDGEVLYTKGCSISEDGARFDFFGSLSGELAPKVEEMANYLIGQNCNIIMESEPLTKDIHYWKCGEIIIPCGGTHVRSTQELSPIKVKRSKKGQSTTRMSCVFSL